MISDNQSSKLMDVCRAINVGYSEEDSQRIIGSYYYYERRIHVGYKPKSIRKFIILAHELGHTFQSLEEFEVTYIPTLEDKREFNLAVERDAWDKGEFMIRTLYPNLPDRFWVIFEGFKKRALKTYIDATDEVAEHYFYCCKDLLSLTKKDKTPDLVSVCSQISLGISI